MIEEINDGPTLPDNALLVSMDATGLYDNIPQDEGLDSLGEALEERENKKVPSGFIKRLFEIVLEWNLFVFHDATYLQEVGVAMGVPPAPNYSDIFMAKRIDKKIWEIADKLRKQINFNSPLLLLLKRFLDDLFLVFQGTTKQIHQLLDKINKIHKNIQFTMQHIKNKNEKNEDKCDCIPKQAILFLDTSCSISEGKTDIDLFRKDCDRNQYLLPSSIHPTTVTKNIPFSLALRIIRTCISPYKRDIRFEELKLLLLDRNYPERLIDSAIERARKIPRKRALRKTIKPKNKEQKGPVFAVKFDPRLPSIPTIQAKHWRAMVSQNQYLSECFPEPPLTAHKRPTNIREFLIRSKVPPNPDQRPKRYTNGMQKCGNQCTACPYISETKKIKINSRNTWLINRKMNCNSYNIIYMIECNIDRCKQRYIGESKRPLKHRLADHRGYIVNQHIDKATGAHYNQPGHSLANLKVTILEQVKVNCDMYRKERERYFINKFDTLQNGLNRQN